MKTSFAHETCAFTGTDFFQSKALILQDQIKWPGGSVISPKTGSTENPGRMEGWKNICWLP
jgi:hypothetical protein